MVVYKYGSLLVTHIVSKRFNTDLVSWSIDYSISHSHLTIESRSV